MAIYADMLFFINIIMNSIILLLTAWAAGIPYQLWRILMAATVGSAYVLAGLLPSMSLTHHPLGKVAMSLLLVVIAFGKKPKQTVLLLTGFFYIVGFILAGAVLGWVHFWQATSFEQLSVILPQFSWTQLLWGSSVGILFMVLILRRMVTRVARQNNIYKVRIEYEGRRIEVLGLLDTGNGLYTITGHTPVIVINYKEIIALLSTQTLLFLERNTPDKWLNNLAECEDAVWLSKVQVVPYRSIGCKNMLVAFRPDHLTLWSGEDRIEISDVVLGIYSGTLSEDGSYEALLHPQILNGLNKKKGAGICA